MSAYSTRRMRRYQSDRLFEETLTLQVENPTFTVSNYLCAAFDICVAGGFKEVRFYHHWRHWRVFPDMTAEFTIREEQYTPPTEGRPGYRSWKSTSETISISEMLKEREKSQ